MAASSRRTPGNTPRGDVTGKDLLEKQEAAEAAKQTPAARAAANARNSQGGVVEEEEVVQEGADEFLPPQIPASAVPAGVVEEIDGEPIVIETVRFRVNEDLEDMTFGGTLYTFRRGSLYSGPRDLAIHLDEKGFLSR